MPKLFPAQVDMTARPRQSSAATLMNMFALSEESGVGRFTVNTVDKVVDFEIAPELSKSRLAVHGFVPDGWITDALFELEPGQNRGVWQYNRGQEENILSGLAYLQIAPEGDAPTLRAQILPDEPDVPRFEDHVTLTSIAGNCQAFMTMFGQFEDVPMKMEPAQVIIARSGATTRADGTREQILGCSVRVGGAQVDGLGRIEIGMFGTQNPGLILSETPESDFPASMSLDVSKSYITPVGEFYRDNEVFEARGITRFPPFGTKFYPKERLAPLRNVRTNAVIGEIKLGWLVPLCWIDPEQEFPSKAVANAHFEEEHSA